MKMLKAFNNSIALLFLMFASAAADEKITADQMLQYYVDGVLEGEWQRIRFIKKMKSDFVFKEAKKGVIDTRSRLEVEEERYAAIRVLFDEISKKEREPTTWSKPRLALESDEVGRIGMPVYSEGTYVPPESTLKESGEIFERRITLDPIYSDIHNPWKDVSGKPVQWTIETVLDEQIAIVDYNGTNFCFRGIDTKYIAKDRQFEILKPVIIDHPTRYSTALGIDEAVRTFRVLTEDEEKRLNEYVVEKLAAAQPALIPKEESEK